MDLLYTTHKSLPDIAKRVVETILAVIEIILVIVMAAIFVGGIVIAIILGWRAIVTLALTALALIVVLIPLILAIVFSVKITESDEKEDEDNNGVV